MDDEVPALQALQLEARAADHEPGLQRRQVDDEVAAMAVDQVPPLQFEQTEDPAPEKVPVPQLRQAAIDVAPAVIE